MNRGRLYANSNAGLICGCKVVGDVAFDNATAGAFVGTNESTGILWASYHVGQTKSTAAPASVGGLVGSNIGTIVSCYHAGKVTGTTTGGIAASNTGTLDNNFFNSTLLTPTYDPGSGVTGKSTGDMTKQAFVYGTNGTSDSPTEGGLFFTLEIRLQCRC